MGANFISVELVEEIACVGQKVNKGKSPFNLLKTAKLTLKSNVGFYPRERDPTQIGFLFICLFSCQFECETMVRMLAYENS